MNTSLHHDQILHDEYRHIPGPEPFADDAEVLAELARIEAQNTPDQGFVTGSLLKSLQRETGTFDRCPRATRRLIADGSSTVAVFLPCKSRTCGFCKEDIDERDVARISASLGEGVIYLATVPRTHWDRIRKRAQRRGVEPVKMPSATDAELMEVLSPEPITEDFEPVSMEKVVDLVKRRPPWSKGRVKTSGPGLIPVKEWDEIETGAKAATETLEMHESLTMADVALCAEILQIETTEEGPYQLRLLAPWDDPRMVALRKWAQDPDGSLEWHRMLWDSETAQGVRPVEEPPIEAYAEPSP